VNIVIAAVAGLVVGIIATVVAVVATMRSSMVVPERSDKSFEATCAAIERVVPGNDGWSFPIESFDMGAKLAAKDALPANVSRIRLYFMCKPSVAKTVLSVRPQLSAIMPCSWSVVELADGSVWVSHMNIGMMAKMMGGVVGDSMAGVARDDARFLEAVLH
jgi:uncharacterized protein (DUF302 family)